MLEQADDAADPGAPDEQREEQRVEKEHRRSRRHERKKRKSRDAKNPDSEPHAFDSSVVMDGNLNNENQPLITNDGDNVKPNTASDDTTHTEQTDFDGGGTDRSSHRKHKKYKKKRRSRAEREEIDKENREHGEDKTNQTGVNNVVDNEQSETQRAARGNLEESSEKNNNSTGDDSNDILQKMTEEVEEGDDVISDVETTCTTLTAGDSMYEVYLRDQTPTSPLKINADILTESQKDNTQSALTVSKPVISTTTATNETPDEKQPKEEAGPSHVELPHQAESGPSHEKLPKDKAGPSYDYDSRQYRSQISQSNKPLNMLNDLNLEHTVIKSLSEKQQEQIQATYGWDTTCCGFMLSLHPNAPWVCVPTPQFCERVQGVRTKRGAKRGRHRWLLKELDSFFSPRFADQTKGRSKLMIGAVNEEHKTFNYGFSISQLGRHGWGVNLSTLEIWHNLDKTPIRPNGPSDVEDILKDEDVSLSHGIELQLDIEAETLSFWLHNTNLRLCTINNVHGKEIYPFYLFLDDGYFPVEIEYLEGPKVDIQETITKIEKMKSYEWNDIVNFRSLFSSQPLQSSDKDFQWGSCSQKLTMSKNCQGVCLKCVPLGKWQMAVSADKLHRGRHCLQFTATHPTHLVLGLVSRDFKRESMQTCFENCANSLLGSDHTSWGWDVSTCKLWHGGRCLSSYPVIPDFDASSYNNFSMTVVFNRFGHNLVSFCGHDLEGNKVDLGIAFINLPCEVWPSVALSWPGEEASVVVDYTGVSGSRGHQQTAVCAIL